MPSEEVLWVSADGAYRAVVKKYAGAEFLIAQRVVRICGKTQWGAANFDSDLPYGWDTAVITLFRKEKQNAK